MYELIIFDMDGLMFDTEKIAYQAWFNTSKKVNFEFDLDVFKQFIGRSEADILKRIVSFYNVSFDEAMAWRKLMRADKLSQIAELKEVPVKRGLYELLSYLKATSIKLALASSSPRHVIDHYLALAHLNDTFDFIISGEDVESSKPDPTIFIRVVEHFDMDKDQALVLEDSLFGIQAANNGGLDVWLVPDYLSIEEMNCMPNAVCIDLLEVKKRLKGVCYEKGTCNT